jgi:hypothetical protein
MTKGETITLFNTLAELQKLNLKGAKFAYMVVRNLSIIKPEIEALEEALKTSEEFNTYEKARLELAKEHAKKDESGNPITYKDEIDGLEKYNIVDQDAFDEAFKVLREEHKQAIEDREQQIKEQNEILKTESTLQLHKIALSDIPEITIGHMAVIEKLVEAGIPSPFNS